MELDQGRLIFEVGFTLMLRAAESCLGALVKSCRQSNIRKTFGGEMLIRIIPTSLLQIVCEIDSKVTGIDLNSHLGGICS